MGNTRPLPQPEAPSGPPAPERAAPARRRSRAHRYLKRAAITLMVLILIAVIGVGILWIATPSASEATQLARTQAAQHGIAYPGPPVPTNFSLPLIATEDKRFYAEPGVDVLAVGRVAWAKVSNGSDQGGATLEQQLAKMLYTPTETGPTAELKQVVLALKLNASLLQGTDPGAVRRGRLLRARLLRTRAGELRLLRPPGGGPHGFPGRHARGRGQRPVPRRSDRRPGQRPPAPRARDRADDRGRRPAELPGQDRPRRPARDRPP